jgi:hypothetical protein
MAEKTEGLTQSQIYILFPVSTTAIGYSRTFSPQDWFADPFLLYTTQVRADGPLACELIELDVGPPEANKTLVSMQSQSRRISLTSGSYGTVEVKVNVAGDHSFAATAADITFGSGASNTTAAFTDATIASSLDPGVAFRTMIYRVILNNAGSGTTKSPQALPIVSSTVMQWPHLELVPVELDIQRLGPIDIITLEERLVSLQNTKSVQRLFGAGISAGGSGIPAAFVDIDLKYRPPQHGNQRPTQREIEHCIVFFSRTLGAVA